MKLLTTLSMVNKFRVAEVVRPIGSIVWSRCVCVYIGVRERERGIHAALTSYGLFRAVIKIRADALCCIHVSMVLSNESISQSIVVTVNMLDFSAEMHQIHFRLGHRPRTLLGELTSLPRSPSWWGEARCYGKRNWHLFTIYWYQQFELLISAIELLISTIRISDINNSHELVISLIRIIDISNSN